MTQRLAMLALSFCAVCVLAHADDQVSDATVEPTGPRTGFFGVTLTPTELLGEDGAKSVAEVFDADDKLEYQLYVPRNYDAAKPAGVIVYISPYFRGGPPKAWNDVLRDRNIIWIGAQNAGNEVSVAKRMFLAMFAPMVLQRDYAMNAERIYIAGMAGGGKTASRVAVLRPNMFKGGLFFSGALFWGENTPPLLDSIKSLRYVFMSGANDFALNETKSAHNKFKTAGVKNTKLMVIRNHGHSLPDADNLERALEFLDTRGGE
ncbi:MAG: hypothetical protein HKN77_08665 [Woeseiaceae bacterium]|nr:hypothetical protein [Woeseiaceae bacterium]